MINATDAEAIRFYSSTGGIPINNTIKNNTIVDNKQLQLSITDSKINNTYIIDSYILNYSFNNPMGIYVRDTNYGEIQLIGGVTQSGTNLSNDIKIGNNSVYVNSSKTGFNISANVIYRIFSFA